MTNPSTPPLFALTPQQAAALQAYKDAGQYPEAYRYLEGLVREQISNADPSIRTDLESTAIWLNRAASINGNDGSFSSELVRGSTREAGNINGTPISEQRFQEVSDGLARDVFDRVLDLNGIPKSEDIIRLDVRRAVDDFGLRDWQWAGTWGDILPPFLGGLGKDYQSLPPPELTRQFAADWMRSAQQHLAGFGRFMFERFASDSASRLAFPIIHALVNAFFGAARTWLNSGDPLVLDLDGDGIEALGISPAFPILFDHDADGVKTATGWIKLDDGIVVRDLNGNGLIDSGRELFGDQTLLDGLNKASNGYMALAQLDSNADGKIDSADAAFGELRIWQDANQDGISQAGELKTLSQLGIASLGAVGTASTTDLGNGNTQPWTGSFTRTNGTTGMSGAAELSGSLLLASNGFYREFTDNPSITADAAALPQMGGSGWVRDLREAMSLGGAKAEALEDTVEAFAAANTRDAQMALIDKLLADWGDTSGKMVHTVGSYGMTGQDGRMVTCDPGTPNAAYGDLIIHPAGLEETIYEATTGAKKVLTAEGEKFLLRLNVLEAFNGTKFIQRMARAHNDLIEFNRCRREKRLRKKYGGYAVHHLYLMRTVKKSRF